MKDRLTFSIPGKPEYMQTVKFAVGCAAGAANFSVEAVEDIKIAVSEACKSISCHGYEGFSKQYDVICDIEDERITILVADNDETHELEKHKKPCLDCPHEGDLAIFVMKSLMDEIEINNESGNHRSIKMVKAKC